MTISAYPSRFGSGPPARVQPIRPKTLSPTRPKPWSPIMPKMESPIPVGSWARPPEESERLPFDVPRGLYWIGAVIVSCLLWSAAIWAVLRVI